MSDLERFVRERAESYGALRRSAPTAIALDRAADRLRQYREAFERIEQLTMSQFASVSDLANAAKSIARTALKETTDVD